MSAGASRGVRPAGSRTGHTGRRPGSADTRGQILDAARTAFGERGFDGASIRDIAARAGVDPALVHHFYGSKQQLFMSAMELPFDFPALVARVLDGPAEGIGERLARSILEVWEAPATRPLILGMIRSAATDPIAAGMLRRLLSEGPLLTAAQAIDQPDAMLRATLAGSHLIGLAMARYVIGVEPLASTDIESVIRTVGPVLQHYLMGDLSSEL
jgi:AcrR family transcriptional regulator